MEDSKTILVVDDEPTVVRFTSKLLEHSGYRVIEAVSGLDGLEKARSERPDLVLLDVILPDIDGLEVCRRIKADPDTGSIYVALLSGQRTESLNQAEGLDAGADAYLLKPVPSRELLARVNALFRLKRMEDQLRRQKDELLSANLKLTEEIEKRRQVEQKLRRRTRELDDRVKKLNCLFGISYLRESPDMPFDQLVQGIVNMIPSAWQYPDIACARITIDHKRYQTDNYQRTPWGQRGRILVYGKHQGDITVGYLESRPEADEGPFLSEERHLIDAIAERMGRIVERIRADEKLRQTHDELEKRVDQRTAELLMANEQLLREVEERMRTEEQLQFRVEFERLITSITSSVVGALADRLDAAVDQALASIGRFTQVDRGDIYLFSPAGRRMKNTHRWRVDVTGPDSAEPVTVKMDDFPWTVDKILTGHVLHVPDVTEMPDAAESEKNRYQAEGIGAFIDVPLTGHNEVIGFLGFSRSGRPGAWSEEDMSLLVIAGQVMANAFERHWADQQLRENEARYRQLVEHTPSGIFEINFENLRHTDANDVVLHLLGYTREEFLALNPFDLLAESSRAQFAGMLKKILNGERVSDYVEFQFRRKNGDELWVSLNVNFLYEQQRMVRGTIVVHDIHERKEAEFALKRANAQLAMVNFQRKLLSKRLIDLLEENRHQIAMELHDHIGQNLTSCKISLEMIANRLRDRDTELADLTETTEAKLVTILRDIKNIAHGLKPSMLDALGLVSSLRELFNETQQNSRIRIDFFHRNIPKRFHPAKELAIYRIAQETLHNIVKHAHAQRVFVNLVRKDDTISLSIEDDGRGFDKDHVMTASENKGPFGLLIMRERAVQLDGEFTMESRPDQGTHILVEMPI